MGALADLISNPGAGGYEFEADLLSPNYIPKSKLVYGADGSATDVTTSTPWPVNQVPASTGTQSSVSGVASSTTILAANTSRKPGSTFYNDSTAILYLLFAAGTASSSNFSVKLFPEDSYSLDSNYTGIVVGIWASATGAARVTELT